MKSILSKGKFNNVSDILSVHNFPRLADKMKQIFCEDTIGYINRKILSPLFVPKCREWVNIYFYNVEHSIIKKLPYHFKYRK